ncbi:uncharacterized protein V1516DRAFT_628513 [Lipomyces oligophaga]|uniref:uncharacterized protein n=1 Tax=Lipomyces oligophaga TaxID=45792 RepID=UPI0034CD0A8A
MDRKSAKQSYSGFRPGPYSRPKRDVPSTPVRRALDNEGSPVKTPGSIFSKVISMFTPRWTSPSKESRATDVGEKQPDSGLFSPKPASIESQSNMPSQLKPFTFTPVIKTPAMARTSPQVSSPSEKLAEFFRAKGDAPLSEIEMEGVLALMRQAQVEQNTLGSADPVKDTPTKVLEPIDEPVTAPSITEQLYPSAPSFTTPVRARRVVHSQTVRAPRYNPVMSPQRRRAATPSLTRPRNLDLPSSSSPFKPRLVKTAIDLSAPPVFPAPSPLQATDKHLTSPSGSDLDGTPKPLSQTASALLSMISPVGSSSEVAQTIKADRERIGDPAVRPFANPYASSHTLGLSPSRRAARKQSLIGTTPAMQKKRRRIIEEIERTMPEEEKKSASAFDKAIAATSPAEMKITEAKDLATQSAPSVPTTSAVSTTVAAPTTPITSTPVKSQINSPFTQFKPAKSSQLRESMVMSPDPVHNPERQSEIPTSKSVEESQDSQKQKSQESQGTEDIFKATTIPAGFGQGPPLFSKKEEPKFDYNEAQKRAMESSHYQAYAPQFYFKPAEELHDVGEAAQKALDTPSYMVEAYKMKFPFPELHSA